VLARVGAAFMDGTHLAYLAGAGACLVAAVAALLLLRPIAVVPGADRGGAADQGSQG
jgi:hypothetical protein